MKIKQSTIKIMPPKLNSLTLLITERVRKTCNKILYKLEDNKKITKEEFKEIIKLRNYLKEPNIKNNKRDYEFILNLIEYTTIAYNNKYKKN